MRGYTDPSRRPLNDVRMALSIIPDYLDREDRKRAHSESLGTSNNPSIGITLALINHYSNIIKEALYEGQNY